MQHLYVEYNIILKFDVHINFLGPKCLTFRWTDIQNQALILANKLLSELVHYQSKASSVIKLFRLKYYLTQCEVCCNVISSKVMELDIHSQCHCTPPITDYHLILVAGIKAYHVLLTMSTANCKKQQ